MNTLEVRNLKKSFGNIKAVQDVSFSVASGSILGLIGRNGAGKTTTIRMVLDIYPPDEGEVLFNGGRSHQSLRDRVGYLPEERGLYAKMKVLDLLLFLAELKGTSAADATATATNYLTRFGLGERTRSKVEELSKGNQQKVQFIAAVVHDPDLIILDEPFSGLDPVNTNLLIDMMLELKARGKAIVFSTHIMDFAEKLCDRIAMIDGGKLVLNGPLDEIKRQFAKRYVTLVGNGDLAFVRTLPYVSSTHAFGQSLGIQLNDEGDAQRLLTELVERGVLVRKFDAIDVTLHDIFVDRTTTADERGDGEDTTSAAYRRAS